MLAITLYILSLIIILTFTTAVFFIAQFKKDNSIIDTAYGLGFIVTAYFLVGMFPGQLQISPYSQLIFFLILFWGLRLSFRIFRKNRNKPEDFRYQAWRKEWSKKGYLYYVSRSYLQIFILQGFIISLVLLPFTLSLTTSTAQGQSIFYGLLIWMIGFFFEVVGDRQLDRFIKNKNPNKGQIMKTGLWKYTRHPNYFGEATMWVGIAYIAYMATGYLAVFISPFVITYLLLFVSGIPMLEKKWKGIPEWEEYKQKTSAFFPLPPRD